MTRERIKTAVTAAASVILILLFAAVVAKCTGENGAPYVRYSYEEEVTWTLANQRYPQLDGLSLTAEKAVYDKNTDSLRVTLENNSGHTVSYGHGQTIEKLVNGTWRVIPMRDNIAFTLAAKLLESGKTDVMEIRTDIYTKALSPGEYRTFCTVSTETVGCYAACAYFTVE